MMASGIIGRFYKRAEEAAQPAADGVVGQEIAKGDATVPLPAPGYDTAKANEAVSHGPDQLRIAAVTGSPVTAASAPR